MNGQTLGVAAGGPPGGVALTFASEENPIWLRVLRSPVRVGRMVVDDVVSAVVPGTCRLCDGPLERAGLVPVCGTCLGRVVADEPVGCWRCGEAMGLEIDMEDIRFAQGMGDQMLCRECRMVPPAFARAVSFGSYDGELRELIRLMKFGRVRGVGRVLGRYLAEAVRKLDGLAAAELMVVPVPLYVRRERGRGFNQADLLAEEMMRVLRRPWKPGAGALVRQKSTESSFALDRRGRRRNMRGAFKVTGDVRSREVLLVDDVLTTGATARECARVLVQAGAAKVWVATVARSQKGVVGKSVGSDVAVWDLGSGTGRHDQRADSLPATS